MPPGVTTSTTSSSTSLAPKLAWAAGVIACGAAAVAGLAVFGTPLLAVVAVGAVAFAALLVRAPLRLTLLATFFLILVADSPQDRPADGMWQSPLYWLGAFLVNNLSSTLGIGGLSFSTLDLLVAMILGAAAVRAFFGTSPAEGWRLPRPVVIACVAVLAAYALWTAIGVLNGGSANIAYWQLRQSLYVPLLALLFAQVGVGARDLRFIGGAVIAAACIKVAVGAFFYFAIAKVNGWSPRYVTSHADTVLFSLAIVILTTRWLLSPTRRHLLHLAAGGLWIWVGIFLNNRRIAYVAVAASMALIFFITPRLRAKRFVLRLAALAAPLFALYVAAGWQAPTDSELFRPVHSVRTIISPDEDTSTESRHIENRNLARSLAESPWLGRGFGQEYSEYELGPDIGKEFALYRALPHNALLGMLFAMGLLGFVVLGTFWALISTTAVRGFFASHTLEERVACLSTAAMVLLYLIQAWGDMVTQNWVGAVLLAMGLAVSGQIVLRNGAFGGDRRVAVEKPKLLGTVVGGMGT